MAGYLTTHVLDTARGRPAAGMRVTLYRIEVDVREKVAEAVTNEDGRTDAPILPQDAYRSGVYELVFAVGPYFDDVAPGSPHFLGDVPVRFGLSEGAHYHVPLLVSPFGYTTYRGS